MEESNKTRIQEFYTRFSTARTEIATRLAALQATTPPDANALNDLIEEVALLRKDLVDATSFLPTYDQRQYEQFLKATEISLDELRSASAPKPKFTFKRKVAKEAPVSPKETVTFVVPPENHTVKDETSSAALSSHLLLSGHTGRYLDRTSHPILESSSDLTISDLDHCVVNLLPVASSHITPDARLCTFTALHCRNLKDTVLILPVIGGSALLHDLKHCTIVLGCHQFRMHTSEQVDVYLSIESNPIIEHCSAIRFARYPRAFHTFFDFPVVPHEISKHLAVQDFSHIRATPSPNWTALPQDKEPSPESWSLVRAKAASESEVRNSVQPLLPP